MNTNSQYMLVVPTGPVFPAGQPTTGPGTVSSGAALLLTLVLGGAVVYMLGKITV